MRKMSKKKEIVFAEDMTDEMMNRAIDVGKAAFNNPQNQGKPNQRIATFIRTTFEKEYGKSWNCVVGSNFGSYVTHEIKTYIYFSVQPGINVLLWKA